ncbi:hypothetical protein FrEUN1fDRAFT_8053 [Parafrankia sp. EUN1f]|nr:hypothetical protein FrEUN1fDRAFT_8053 [Parafrankia sp. EUN1f]
MSADPWGVPRSGSTSVPSGCRVGAASQRRTYSRIHFWSVFASTALTIRSCGTLSKNFSTSRSRTQSCFQQRTRHLATASIADRPTRYPSESTWKISSARFSRRLATTVCAILSAMVGTPSMRMPRPPSLGIGTARTGLGKYDPELIRFQIWYSWSFRSFSNSVRDTPSTPGAPLLALTFW